jgi:hypothetical protein
MYKLKNQDIKQKKKLNFIKFYFFPMDGFTWN